MKKNVFVILSTLIMYHTTLMGQDLHSPKVGVTYTSFGINDVFRFTPLDGAGGFEGKGFYAIGLNYLQPVNNWLSVETGIEYVQHNISTRSSYPPNMNFIPWEEKLNLMNVPLTLRASFLKYFFVNGGLVMDIDISKGNLIHNQTGIGALLGAAVKYDFKNEMSVFINPYFRFHSLIPFSDTRYHQRAFDSGFRFGVEFPLGRK